MLNVEVIDTSELGDRSYVVHDGSTAVVIDPQRDIDRVQAILDEHGLTLAAVAETHIHNDYVTGGLELARQTGADYLVCADDEVSFDRRPVSDGDTLSYGSLELRAIATPGHTHTHLSYAVSRRGPRDEDRAVRRRGRVHRRVPALRQRGPHRPARRGGDRHAHPRPVPLRPQAGLAAARRGRRLPHARLRQLLLLRLGLRRGHLHHRGGEGAQRRVDRGRRGRVRDQAGREPHGLPGLLRTHGRPQQLGPGPDRPERTRERRRAPSCDAGSTPASGSWTCATSRPTPAATCAAASASTSAGSSPPTSAG